MAECETTYTDVVEARYIGWRYVGHGCWQCTNCLDTIFHPTEPELIQCPHCGAKIDEKRCLTNELH